VTVDFVLNGSPVSIEGVAPHTTLLEWLRNSGLTGSKEGCAEGECGACAVVMIRRPSDGPPCFEPINGCLMPLAEVHGRELVSVEGVAGGSRLHPVQEAMVRLGGSQCGYCTPGFVMSLFAEYYRPGRGAPDPEAISGNLCRCTGYRPIADALGCLPTPIAADHFTERLVRSRPGTPRVDYSADQRHYLRPTTLEALFATLREFPDATLIAGGTDVMVEVNQRGLRPRVLVSVAGIGELEHSESRAEGLLLGAAATLSDLERMLAREPDAPALLTQLWPLFSSRLIRNRATLGGNLATASPIGDSAPVLLALDTSLRLLSEAGERVVPLSEFFLDYRKTALRQGEVIASLWIPRPFPRLSRFYKVSKRPLDDISSVAGAFCLDLGEASEIVRLRLAYGGVAATPLRLTSVEQLAQGRRWDEETRQLIATELGRHGTPLSDQRGSAGYRRLLMSRLFERFCFDTDDPSSPASPLRRLTAPEAP
jgi:xanthine dehydrogenase small subunit